MVFSGHLAVVQLALRSPLWKTEKVQIAIRDSTSLKPGDVIKPIHDVLPRGQAKLSAYISDSMEKTEWVKQGAISAKGNRGHEFKIELVDVVLMNPPFTRQERIPAWLKKEFPNRFSSYKKFIHGQMGFAGYFIFLADRFLKPGGRLGFVLPSTILRIPSYEGIRRLLLEKSYHIEYIVTTDSRSAFSESTAFREMLLIARKLTSGEKPSATKFINLKTIPRTEIEVDRLAEEIINA